MPADSQFRESRPRGRGMLEIIADAVTRYFQDHAKVIILTALTYAALC